MIFLLTCQPETCKIQHMVNQATPLLESLPETLPSVNRENRLGPEWKDRLARAGITQERVALMSHLCHPAARRVTVQFVNAVLNGKGACPEWLRGLIRDLVEAAEHGGDGYG